MKISKLLNKLIILIFFIASFFVSSRTFSTEPVDIWEIEKKDPKENLENTQEDLQESSVSIFDSQENQNNDIQIIKDDEDEAKYGFQINAAAGWNLKF